MRKQKGDFDADTLSAVAYLKTILGRGQQYSKRGVCYTLLSEGLVWHKRKGSNGERVVPSTKDFHNVIRCLNRVLEGKGPLCDEYFNDECFDDNRRRTVPNGGWKTKAEFDDFCKSLWKLDYWQNQPNYVEVWIEKDTVSYLIQEVTTKWQVPLQVSSGNFGRTFLRKIAAGPISSTNVPVKILYIGDFDPSGLDIERAAQRGETEEEWAARRRREGQTSKQCQEHKDGIADYLEKSCGWEPGRFDRQVEWIRVGVTEDDLRNVPVRARVLVKAGSIGEDGKKIKGDSRTTAYVAQYGEYGAEVEALEVWQRGLLAERLDAAISTYHDPVAWAASEEQEKSER